MQVGPVFAPPHALLARLRNAARHKNIERAADQFRGRIPEQPAYRPADGDDTPFVEDDDTFDDIFQHALRVDQGQFQPANLAPENGEGGQEQRQHAEADTLRDPQVAAGPFGSGEPGAAGDTQYDDRTRTAQAADG